MYSAYSTSKSKHSVSSIEVISYMYLQGDHVCMSSPIVYNTTPPSSGPHRMIWPQYGEYSYVPPQRWVHSLEVW